jgi:hypothetical protein
VLLAVVSKGLAQQPGAIRLFDEKTLAGWVQRGGQAKYHVEDGMIVGTAVPNSPNSFLCTRREFTDFSLELDVRVDAGLNSGIQIRSHYAQRPTVAQWRKANGREETIKIPEKCVFGYQVEVDPGARAYSGGIYDEARRGWLYDLKGERHQAARKVFRPHDWNHYRIEAQGKSLKTWINGVSIADLEDDMDSSGFIALQVHSVDHDRPLQVRWRNIWIRELPEQR